MAHKICTALYMLTAKKEKKVLLENTHECFNFIKVPSLINNN